VAIDLLGGRPVTPRAVTGAEAGTLALLRQRNRAAGGGTVSLVLPAANGSVLTASGWLDWRNGVAYLAVTDPARAKERLLVRADRTGVSTLAGVPRGTDDRPPMPMPRGEWRRTLWPARVDTAKLTDIDLLINELLSLAGPARDSPEPLRRTASWLRAGRLVGAPVTGFEMPEPTERVPRGHARLRYWIGDDGVLRRLEVRTRAGFGQLDVHVGPVPYLSRPLR
jgi:hypothetical protein